jgi:hypothetical protein
LAGFSRGDLSVDVATDGISFAVSATLPCAQHLVVPDMQITTSAGSGHKVFSARFFCA